MGGCREAQGRTALLRTQLAENRGAEGASVTAVALPGLYLPSVLLSWPPRPRALHTVGVNCPTSVCPAGLLEKDRGECVRTLAGPGQGSRNVHPL